MVHDYKRDIKGLWCRTIKGKRVMVHDYKRDIKGLLCLTIKGYKGVIVYDYLKGI